MKEKTIVVCNISKKTISISWIPSFKAGEKRKVSEELWKRILRNYNFEKCFSKEKKETEKKDV